MIRPFLVMLLKVYLWAQEETPTGYYYFNSGARSVNSWCIQMSWKKFRSEGYAIVTVFCQKQVKWTLNGLLQLQEDKYHHYEVTEKGDEDYEAFIDLVIEKCSIPLYRFAKPKDLFTFKYEPDRNQLVTRISHISRTMVPGECS